MAGGRLAGRKLGWAWERWAGSGERVAWPGGGLTCEVGGGQRDGRDQVRAETEERERSRGR